MFVCLFISGAIMFSCKKSSSSSSNNNNTTPQTTTSNVSIASMAFAPGSITVAKGTTVVWTNNDATAHTVTSSDGSGILHSGNMDHGATYSYVFNTAGTFPYKCDYHSSMVGSVVVQ
jgi:plastocyanin